VLTRKSYLAVAAFGQMLIFVAFIPANNQVLMSRQGLWILISIFILWFLKKLLQGIRA
jgi:hypothetical protein